MGSHVSTTPKNMCFNRRRCCKQRPRSFAAAFNNYHNENRRRHSRRPEADAVAVLARQRCSDSTNNLAHLPKINSKLFVTSAPGAVNAASVLIKLPNACFVGVCDTPTAELVADSVAKKVSYSFFSVEYDTEDLSPGDFCAQFLQPALFIKAALEQKAPAVVVVVVHCLMGINRSCTAVCMAAILLRKNIDAKWLIEYVRSQNQQTRCTALFNDAFVKYLVGFAAFVNHESQRHKHVTCADVAATAHKFNSFYETNVGRFRKTFEALGVRED